MEKPEQAAECEKPHPVHGPRNGDERVRIDRDLAAGVCVDEGVLLGDVFAGLEDRALQPVRVAVANLFDPDDALVRGAAAWASRNSVRNAV